MVRITEDPVPVPEPEPNHQPENGPEEWFPEDFEAEIYDGDHYKAFLRGQLEVFLPSHDQAQDELIQILPSFIFLPEDASDDKKKVYDEVCAKRVRLMRLQRERDALTDWFMNFLAGDVPLVTREMHTQCQEKVKRFYTGKARFYRTCRHVHKLLYKLHSINRRR